MPPPPNSTEEATADPQPRTLEYGEGDWRDVAMGLIGLKQEFDIVIDPDRTLIERLIFVAIKPFAKEIS